MSLFKPLLTPPDGIRTLATVMLHLIVPAAVVFLGISASALSFQGEDTLGATAGLSSSAVNTVGQANRGTRREAPTTPDDSPAQWMLVLRNGRVIEGRIEQVGGDYVIDFGNGQVRINSAEVEFVCDGLEDGYRRKRAAIRPGNLHHHLTLAQWCLRHELLEHTAAELADAMTAEPDHPMIGILRHRLDLAREPPPPARADVARQVTPGPSSDELDRMIRNLPNGTVETFTRSVQPVLMNHCATGGCHGPQSADGLRLFRVSLGKRASRRVTQRNLYSVLSFVDRNTPLDSRLLTVPGAPHGDIEHAIFNGHQAAQYRRLINWVVQLSCQLAPQEHRQQPVGQAVPDTVGGDCQAQPDLRVSESCPQEPSEEAQKARPLSAGGKKTDISPLDKL